MNGNEIITIHLGPFANYVGALLINHEYRQTFNTTLPVSPYESGTHSGNGGGTNGQNGQNNSLPVDRDILFQPSKPINASTDTASSRQSVYYIPRTLFCDFEGAIPTTHANQIAMGNFAKSKQHQSQQYRNPGYDPLTQYEDTFSSYQSFYDDSHAMNPRGGQGSRGNGQEQEKQHNFVTHEQLYWHNILYPHLRPMTSSPERVILTAASHVLGLKGDTIPDAEVIMGKPPSATSSKHEDTFGETIFDQFRTLVERSDHPQGVRVIADTSSIWAGVCLQLLHHIVNQYPTLQTLVIGVSTPCNLNPNSTNVLSEIFAYNSHIIPYSPFSPNPGAQGGISPSQIKTAALNLRENRLINSSLFASEIYDLEKCAFVPITFPLTSPLQSFISSKVPQLIHQYQAALKANGVGAVSQQQTRSQRGGSDNSNESNKSIGSLSAETQLNLTALTTTLQQQYTSVLFHYLTAPHIAISISSLCFPLAFIKAATTTTANAQGAKKEQSTTIMTLPQLITTIRPRNPLSIATLAHRHDPLLYTNSIIGSQNLVQNSSFQNSSQSGTAFTSSSAEYLSIYTDYSLFPMLDIPSIGNIPILSNLYPNQHQNQIKTEEKRRKLAQEGFEMITDSHHGSNTSGSNNGAYYQLYGENEEPIDSHAQRMKRNIVVGNAYTVGNLDVDYLDDESNASSGASAGTGGSSTSTAPAASTSQQHRVVNGIFTTGTSQQQWRYECEKRHGAMQRSLYGALAMTKPSQFFIIPYNLTPLPSTPLLLYTADALSTMSELPQVFGYSNIVGAGGKTTATATSATRQYFTKHTITHSSPTTPSHSDESFSSIFISPQLSPALTMMANHLKQMDIRSTQRVTHFRYIEQDDWINHYNNLASMATEYKEMDIYGNDLDC